MSQEHGHSYHWDYKRDILLFKKEHNFNETDFIKNYSKKRKKFIKKEIGEAIYSQLFKNRHTKDQIDEYIETINFKNILLAK